MLRSLTTLFFLLSCIPLFATPESKPNIVIFLIDDLGYADCGFLGGKDIKTPQIDALAQSGAVLESHYVQPVCSPTRAALLTGRYATHTGVYSIVRPGAEWGLPLAERLLSSALKEAGYCTSICGKWHLGEYQPAYTPTRRGFDHQYGHRFGALDYFTHIRDGKHDWYRNDEPLKAEGYATHLIAQEACKIVREKPGDKPLFLYVPFNGIHSPHQVPAEYEKPYDKLPKLRRSIAGMLAAVDEAIGQIAAALKEKGLTDNTLIVFSSDNGGPSPGRATDNTPLRAGKGTIYEGGIRAAAFATWPGKIPAGIRIKEPMHISDWFPTLLKLCGAPTDQKLPVDGRDVWPMLTKAAKSPHEALLLLGTKPGEAAIRQGDWKLLMNASIKDAEESDDAAATKTKLELYNLADDLGEKKELSAAHPEKLNELRNKLAALLKDAVPPGSPKSDTQKEKPAKKTK
jgi:arylsulfatase A-like enzyme